MYPGTFSRSRSKAQLEVGLPTTGIPLRLGELIKRYGECCTSQARMSGTCSRNTGSLHRRKKFHGDPKHS